MNHYVSCLAGIFIGFGIAAVFGRLVLWPYVRKLAADDIADRINSARYKLWRDGELTRGESNAIIAVQGSIWRRENAVGLGERIRAGVSCLGHASRIEFAKCFIPEIHGER